MWRLSNLHSSTATINNRTAASMMTIRGGRSCCFRRSLGSLSRRSIGEGGGKECNRWSASAATATSKRFTSLYGSQQRFIASTMRSHNSNVVFVPLHLPLPSQSPLPSQTTPTVGQLASALQHPSKSTTGTTATTDWDVSSYLLWALGSCTASMMLLSRTENAPTTTLCQATPGDTQTTVASDANDTDVVNDPYANLPDEDEPTDCSMCQTFRQGPCRPYWRKLERCFKDSSAKNAADDSDEDSNVGAKCVRYFTPHQECLSQYINLYQLIDLHQTKQSLADDTEQAMAEHERQWWIDIDNTADGSTQPTIDWSVWKDFVHEMGLSFSQTIPQLDHGTKLPLFQRLPPNVEPVLVSAPCSVPMACPLEDGKLLKFAYAVDQDGFVLGLAYNRDYGDLLEQAKSVASDDDKAKKTESEPPADVESSSTASATTDSTATTLDFTIYLLPGETQTVRICAMYFENPLLAAPDKAVLDAILYKTKTPYNLQQVVKQQ